MLTNNGTITGTEYGVNIGDVIAFENTNYIAGSDATSTGADGGTGVSVGFANTFTNTNTGVIYGGNGSAGSSSSGGGRGGNGVYADGVGVFSNAGLIVGGSGGNGGSGSESGGNGGYGGNGVEINGSVSTSFTNTASGSITGGDGGEGGKGSTESGHAFGGNGGDGGNGVYVDGYVPIFTNAGLIQGGNGGNGGSAVGDSEFGGAGGSGGNGVNIGSGGAFVNSGSITGGNGGAGGGASINGYTYHSEAHSTIGGDPTGPSDNTDHNSGFGGDGGNGVYVGGYLASLTNTGSISGGLGGNGGDGITAGNGGQGGNGVELGSVGVFNNGVGGVITGAQGGYGGDGSHNGTFSFSGTYSTEVFKSRVETGYSDYGYTAGAGGRGGAGVDVQGFAGSFQNSGTITGGNGGGGGAGYASTEYAGGGNGGNGGNGVELGSVGDFTNNGSITGGNGGDGGWADHNGNQQISFGGTSYGPNESGFTATYSLVSGNGGAGGAGVYVNGNVQQSFVNTATIMGGNGGQAGLAYNTEYGMGGGNGGSGGAGVFVGGTLGSFNNSGSIIGGNGGDAYVSSGGNLHYSSDDYQAGESGFTMSVADGNGGDGGTGVFVGGAVTTFVNSGLIQGGNGGNATDYGAFGGNGGSGGDGVYFASAVAGFANSGHIVGGNGGYGGNANTFDGYHSEDGSVPFNYQATSAHGFGGDGGTGVHFGDTVGTFSNSGSITGGNGGGGGNADEYGGIGGNGGDGVNMSGVTNDGDSFDVSVNSFVNTGTITGGNGGAGGYGFSNGERHTGDSYTGTAGHGGNGGYGVYITGSANVFTNSGSITGGNGGTGGSAEDGGGSGGDGGYGVAIENYAATFTNSGKIVGGNGGNGGEQSRFGGGIYTDYGNAGDGGLGVYLGSVGTFVNSGLIQGGNGGDASTYAGGGDGGTGVRIDGGVASFSNSGQIIGGNGGTDEYAGGDGADGVYLNGTVGTFDNSGSIAGGHGGISSSYDGVGVEAYGQVGQFTNSGTIKGYAGVILGNDAGTTLTNSGLIQGTWIGSNRYGRNYYQDGLAVMFGSGADTLDLKTGGKFLGDVEFGDGINTFDFSAYHGSLVLGYYGNLDPAQLVPGSNLYVQTPQVDDAPGLVVIVSDASERFGYVPVTDLVSGLSDLVEQQLAGIDLPTNGVTPQAAKPAPTIASAAAPADTGRRAWALGFGGGSWINNDDNIRNAYGALAAGSDIELQQGFRMGILGGVAHGQLNVDGDLQTVTANTGFVGVYGRTTTNAIDLDFQLLGGVSGNTSTRTISTPNGDDTATANFAGWFIAPQVAASAPVLKMDNGQLKVVGKLGYIGGGFGGYTETGSIYAATVGAQTVSLFTAYAGLSDEMVVGMTSSGPISAKASLGVYSQTNTGGSTVPVSVYGMDTSGSVAPSGTSFGLKTGFSFDIPVTASASVGAGANASVSNAGQFGGAASLKITGSY